MNDYPRVRFAKVNVPESTDEVGEFEIYWGTRFSGRYLESNPKLEWIHFGSVGVDKLNGLPIAERGLEITSSRGLMIPQMTTAAIAFMTSLARGHHWAWKLRKKGELSRESFDQYFTQIFDLEGQTALIAGYGDVGKALATVLQSLGMKIITISRDLRSGQGEVAETYPLTRLKEAVEEADFVINLLPLNSSTARVFNSSVFEAMKKTSFFISLGRGETVVESDLFQALTQQKLLGAGLDVFESEPLSPANPLLSLDNVIASPHIAGLSQTYWDKQVALFRWNLDCYLAGRTAEMRNRVFNVNQ